MINKIMIMHIKLIYFILNKIYNLTYIFFVFNAFKS